MLPPFVKLCDSVIVRLKLISTAEKMVDPNCFHGIVSHLAVFFHSGKQSLPILLPTSYFFLQTSNSIIYVSVLNKIHNLTKGR